MAIVTSKASGNWSDGSTWDSDPAIPVNNDDVVIDGAHTVSNFNVDMSGWANGIGLTVNGEFQCATGAGTYYLKCKADIDGSGTFRAGTSGTALPFAAKFRIDFDAGAFHFDGSGGLTVLLYDTEPTYTYVKLSAQEIIGQTELSVDTDVTGDIWADGDDVAICDMNKELDTEVTTIDAGGIAAGAITVVDALTAQKESGAYIVLINRNIKVFNTTDTLYRNLDSTCYVRCENDCLTDKIISRDCDGTEFAGVDWDSSGSNTFFHIAADNCIVSGIMCGSGTSTGIYQCDGTTLSGLAVGLGSAFLECYNPIISGEIRGCNIGINSCYSPSMTSAAVFDNCYRPVYNNSGGFYYGTITNNDRNCELDRGGVFSCTMSGANSGDLMWCLSGQAFNTTFGSATEFFGYTDSRRGKTDYFESFDHDQVANAFKAWCRGGIVVSSTSAPLPTGHTIRYDFTAEDTTQVYPVYRQFETTVQPGTAIEVEGYIAIPNGENLTGYAPALQIIDKFADPLVDATQEPLDECEIPDPDGSETGYQAISVIWANQGDAPRTVIVRMIVWHDGGGNDVVVYGAWSIADYKDQINNILIAVRPLATTVATSDTTISFTLADGLAVNDAYNNMVIAIQDADDDHWEERTITDWTAGKVVTVNTAFSFTPAVDDIVWLKGCAYGGAVQANVNAILANLGQVHQVEDETPGGAPAGGAAGIAEGCP